MNLNISKEWFEKRAALEANHEIGAGLRRYVYGPTLQEIAQEASDAFGARLRGIMKGESNGLDSSTAPAQDG